MIKVIEFESKKEYKQWLAQMGNTVRIISAVPVRTRWWSPLTSLATVESGQIYTVTYEPVVGSSSEPHSKPCAICHAPNPLDANFCGMCGTALLSDPH